MGNYAKTGILLAALTALFMFVGNMIGGQQGMMMALIMAAGMNLFSYWNADKMVLRMYRAQPADESSRLYQIVKRLCDRNNLIMPKVYYIGSEQPNAFATGRSPEHASVAATESLVGMLTEEEVSAVMAHELAHVQNRDTLTMTITATFAGAIGMLGNMLMFGGGRYDENGNRSGGALAIIGAIIAPLAASLVQMAISRSREYQADKFGAKFSGNPMALASALAKIDNYAHNIMNTQAENNPQTAHLFIINPLAGLGRDKMFSTHPSTANRIEALKAIALEMGQSTGSSNIIPDDYSYPARKTGTDNPWG